MVASSVNIPCYCFTVRQTSSAFCHEICTFTNFLPRTHHRTGQQRCSFSVPNDVFVGDKRVFFDFKVNSILLCLNCCDGKDHDNSFDRRHLIGEMEQTDVIL